MPERRREADVWVDPLRLTLTQPGKRVWIDSWPKKMKKSND